MRRLRERLGPTAEEIAGRLGWSTSKLSRIENARIGVRVSDVRLLLELYEVDEGHMGEILALAQATTQRGWWADYRDVFSDKFAAFVSLEDEAGAALNFASYTIPGLLQDAEYAHHVLASAKVITVDSPHKIARRLEARMRRQELLSRANPLNFSAVIDESVLLRLIGSPAVMRRQLDKLVKMASQRNVNLYVLPLNVPREPVLGEAFTMLEFESAYEVDFPTVIYIDNSWTTAAEFQADDVTHMYRQSWEILKSASLSAEESVAHIARLEHEVWRS